MKLGGYQSTGCTMFDTGAGLCGKRKEEDRGASVRVLTRVRVCRTAVLLPSAVRPSSPSVLYPTPPIRLQCTGWETSALRKKPATVSRALVKILNITI